MCIASNIICGLAEKLICTKNRAFLILCQGAISITATQCLKKAHWILVFWHGHLCNYTNVTKLRWQWFTNVIQSTQLQHTPLSKCQHLLALALHLWKPYTESCIYIIYCIQPVNIRMQGLALMIIWWPAWLRSQAFQIVGVAGFIKLLNMMTLTGYLYVNVLNEKDKTGVYP